MDDFLSMDSKIRTMVVKGYAGTGKTSIISALVKTLPLFNFKFMLLAPTGRAAKVMSGYAKRSAYTIHKIIYKQVAEPGSGLLKFKLTKNYNKDTIYIIDEASMLSEISEFGNQGLLSDLFTYVFSHDTNKIILVGDTAQLPPVGHSLSSGLDEHYLASKLKEQVLSTELKDVMRQQSGSGILKNATYLRNLLIEDSGSINFDVKGQDDIFAMSGDRLEDGLRYAYEKFGLENTMIICRSNRDANNYNRHIRNSILFRTEEVEAGDLLMIVRNNYSFVPPDTPSGFLANGDFVEVMKVSSSEEIYSKRFLTLMLKLVDYPEVEAFEAKVILDSLHAEAPSLTKEEQRALYQEIRLDYSDLKNPAEINEAMRKDPYLNALQIKYAYAVTCHKSQGGQWEVVFVDQGYLDEKMISSDYIRWLYTALTRATQQVFLVNFHSRFFENQIQ